NKWINYVIIVGETLTSPALLPGGAGSTSLRAARIVGGAAAWPTLGQEIPRRPGPQRFLGWETGPLPSGAGEIPTALEAAPILQSRWPCALPGFDVPFRPRPEAVVPVFPTAPCI